MAECQVETVDVSVMPLSEEVRKVEQVVECSVSAAEPNLNSAGFADVENPSDILSEQMSNLNGLASQTAGNLPSGVSQQLSAFGGVISSRPDSAETAGSSGSSQKDVLSLVDSIGYIDSVSDNSFLTNESMELGKADSPSERLALSRENSDCKPISPRETTNSAMSVDSNREDSNLELMRLNAGSALSDTSSYAWMREESMGSRVSMGSNTSSGNNKEEFFSARESLNSQSSTDSGRMGSNQAFNPAELTNQLIEGPCITLPPSELAVKSAYQSHPQQVSSSDSGFISSEQSSSIENKPDLPVTVLSQAQAVQKEETPPQSGIVKKEVNNHGTQAQTGQGNQGSQPSSSATSGEVKTAPTSPSAPKPKPKKTPNDFIFGKVIGEGSYSTVYLAKEVSTKKEFAIKVCDKKHLIRERKTHFVMREKEVLMKLDHPFFIKLAYTFQDPERLYYVLTYARNGELLCYLNKLSVFDVPCTTFYSAEIILALEYLHSLGIIHRDLKPENILLSEDMHIKITDFGTSKILPLDSNGNAEKHAPAKHRNSFVGTAEYVSPEVLNNQPANFGSDLWALGCIIYQCLSGSMPFRSGNEYQTFQKIVKVEYDFPEGFHPQAKDLVEKLLVFEPDHRLGMIEPDGMVGLKQHPFYAGIDWEGLPQSTPPTLMPYLPATGSNPEFWGQEHRAGFDDQRLAEIITGQTVDGAMSPEIEELPIMMLTAVEDEERKEKLKKQRQENQFHQFVEDNLIIKQGFVDKRKGLFARKRMLLLTEGPHLYYVDAHNKVLKGEIPWSKYLRPEAKNFKIFFVHTPNRTYYLESRMHDAQHWVKKIKEVWKKYYGQDEPGK